MTSRPAESSKHEHNPSFTNGRPFHSQLLGDLRGDFGHVIPIHVHAFGKPISKAVNPVMTPRLARSEAFVHFMPEIDRMLDVAGHEIKEGNAILLSLTESLEIVVGVIPESVDAFHEFEVWTVNAADSVEVILPAMKAPFQGIILMQHPRYLLWNV